MLEQVGDRASPQTRHPCCLCQRDSVAAKAVFKKCTEGNNPLYSEQTMTRAYGYIYTIFGLEASHASLSGQALR